MSIHMLHGYNVEFLHTKCLHNKINGKRRLDNVKMEVSNAKKLSESVTIQEDHHQTVCTSKSSVNTE